MQITVLYQHQVYQYKENQYILQLRYDFIWSSIVFFTFLFYQVYSVFGNRSVLFAIAAKVSFINGNHLLGIQSILITTLVITIVHYHG